MKTLLFIPFLFVCSMVIGQSSKIIGKPIRIGELVGVPPVALEVAQFDFPEGMLLGEAKKACANLGSGWRIPTKDELNFLYENKKKIGMGMSGCGYYFSSTETEGYAYGAWYQSFCNGAQRDGYSQNGYPRVRAVRGQFELEVIGTPIKIGKLEVAQYDFLKYMNWNDAVKACADLGGGWRLPTIEELSLLYKNKVKIAFFADYIYWSSNEYDGNSAWVLYCSFGGEEAKLKGSPCYVRAVRSF